MIGVFYLHLEDTCGITNYPLGLITPRYEEIIVIKAAGKQTRYIRNYWIKGQKISISEFIKNKQTKKSNLFETFLIFILTMYITDLNSHSHHSKGLFYVKACSFKKVSNSLSEGGAMPTFYTQADYMLEIKQNE